ncbi:MAG: hypothetical protein ABEJ75_03450 [Candidatus Nanohaloarchaea archaeon]
MGDGTEELESDEKSLQDIFEDVAGEDHVEVEERYDDGGIDSRDLTGYEEEEVDVEDDAGYEGFT